MTEEQRMLLEFVRIYESWAMNPNNDLSAFEPLYIEAVKLLKELGL